jgi:hypothetical protein
MQLLAVLLLLGLGFSVLALARVRVWKKKKNPFYILAVLVGWSPSPIYY